MKTQLQLLLAQSLAKLVAQGGLNEPIEKIKVQHSKHKKHGDFCSNIAFVLAKKEGRSPQKLAAQIVANLPYFNKIAKTEIAANGFINFFIAQTSSTAVIDEIINKKRNYGKLNLGNDNRVLIEFVSANPTGPLHVGHGRGAAYGATIANILREIGFLVDNEYYINDSGRQIDILTVSIYLRYLSILGQELRFPDNAYKGNYIKDIANYIIKKHGKQYLKDSRQIFSNVCKDYESNKELYIDQLIANTKKIIKKNYATILKIGVDYILKNIKSDLSAFGVDYQRWFSEKSLLDSDLPANIIKKLQDTGNVYQKQKALWFKNSKFNDEDDKVVVRANGAYTYFATDIAYHFDKFERGYTKIINIWGADHHGYIGRIKASIKALCHDSNKLEVILVQFANLYKDKTKITMSTRSGEFVSLKELFDEVGKDAARFFYILCKADQHMDFDLNLAKSRSNDNPVFYIQYAHARICSILAKQDCEKSITDKTPTDLLLLNDDKELAIIKNLNKYQDVLNTCAKNYEPHILAYYLRELAKNFHSYYNSCEILVTNAELRKARLILIKAVKQIFVNGLNLLGVSSPENM